MNLGLDGRLAVVEGDITGLDVDAVVNAANETLLGGGGVDGAIHRAAGSKLLKECRSLGGCPTGEAKLTGGHNLAARYVIHTVGPVWRGGGMDEDALLESCYRRTLALAAAHDVRTIAFPAISTGVYRFPLICATAIAVTTVIEVLSVEPSLERVLFCCFGAETTAAYRAELSVRGYPRAGRSSED